MVLFSDIAKQVIAKDRAPERVNAFEILAKPVTVHSLTHRLVSVIDRPRRFIDAACYFGPDRRRQDLPFAGDDRRKTEPTR